MDSAYVTQGECSERMGVMHNKMEDFIEGFVELRSDIKWIKRILAILAILAGKYIFNVDLTHVVSGI